MYLFCIRCRRLGTCANLQNGLDGGFVSPRRKEEDLCAAINTYVSISLEVVHLLEDLFVTSNIGLEVADLEFPFVLEGTNTATKKGRYTILYVFFLFVYCSDTKEIL